MYNVTFDNGADFRGSICTMNLEDAKGVLLALYQNDNFYLEIKHNWGEYGPVETDEELMEG